MPKASPRFAKDRRGAAVVEFALVAPLLAMLLFGMVAYGQLFWLSHSIQQIANDAARATVAGLTQAERQTLARASAAHAGARTDGIVPGRLSVTVEQTAPWVTVTARYDASNMAILRTRVLPLPDALIERRATVRMGAGA